MKTKWTKADAKRAEKMGRLLCHRGTVVPWVKWPVQPLTIHAFGGRFKSDDDAIYWVIQLVEQGYASLRQFGFTEDDQRTARKALFL